MAAVSSTAEREAMKLFWEEHSEPTVEAMMLDSQAQKLDKEERPEILAMLPPLKGLSIVELGAGIGRFTQSLACSARRVLAVDFMEALVEKNKEANGHMSNITFQCADVMSDALRIEDGTADLVFSNWLLMYLSDEEVTKLAHRMLRWLKVGGCLFFRESCFHQSGDQKRTANPTHYRDPAFYNKAFEGLHQEAEDGSTSTLELLDCKCVATYVHLKKNQNQVCWLWRKVTSQGPAHASQHFLDTVQYTPTGILRYERIFGEGFVSTGGIDTTREFVSGLHLLPGQKVLDVGCGIGGGDFYMAETYDVDVYGIDLSMNMVSIALERAVGHKFSVEFEVADCTTKDFPDSEFDVVYSRDTILHIQDKPALFRRFFKWLKPGGRVLITDYCRGSHAESTDFLEYVKQRGYDLHEVAKYGQMLKGAGFADVVAEDRTKQFVEVLQRELKRTAAGKEKFIADFSESDYNYIVDGWKAKLERCARGEQCWGLFKAVKPSQ